MRKALRNRPLNTSLILINQEDYKIYGDVVITGQLIVINSSLTVKGSLTISENKTLKNQVFISNSKISASLVDSEVDIIANGGIIRAESLLYCPNIYGGTSLYSDGLINIYDNSCVDKVIARAYFVGGNNNSQEVNCLEFICILGDSTSKAMHAQKLHIEGNADFGSSNIFTNRFTSNGHVRNCYYNLGFK